MQEMRYESPRTLEAAVALLAGASTQARVLAGGTDLLIQMRGGRVEPEMVIDVKGIPEMTAIAADNGAYRFGAAVPCMVLVENKEFGSVWPGVQRADSVYRHDVWVTTGEGSSHHGASHQGGHH